MTKIFRNAALAAVSLVSVGQIAAADVVGEGYNDHMMYGDGFGFGYGFFGFGMMILFWGGIILIAVLAYRTVVHGGPAAKDGSALETLRERLARGDIDPEEFEARKKVLEG